MVGAINRRNSYLKAVRKQKLDMKLFHWWYSEDRGYGLYDNLHQYSKNKIHCSCPQCSAKTRNKGSSKHRSMSPSINYKISDQRKIDRLAYVE